MKLYNSDKIIRFVVAAIFVSMLVSVAEVQAQTDERKARASFRLGRAHYDNGDFLKAAEAFEKAYKYSQKPQLLYNVYLAYRDANVQKQAAWALKKYLNETKDVPNRAQLEARLIALERGLQAAEQAEEQPKEDVPPVAPPPQVEPQPVEEIPESTPVADTTPSDEMPEEQESDEAGEFPLVPVILMGTGGAMIIGSIITGVMASSAQSELEDKCENKVCPPDADLEDLKSTRDSGQTLAVVTDVLLFGGIAAAGTGVVLFLLNNSEEQESQPMAGHIGCSTTGCAGSVRLHF